MRFKDRRRGRLSAKIFISGLLLLAVTLLLQWAFNKSEPLILPIAEREFAAIITSTVYNAVKDIDPCDTVLPIMGDGDKIYYFKTDTARVNQYIAHILECLDRDIGDRDIEISIPIGDIIGDSISLSQGPEILIELNQYRAVNTDVVSSFESAGINQTLHRLTLILKAEAVVLLPGLNTQRITLDMSLPISETLIVGQTPGTYIVRQGE